MYSEAVDVAIEAAREAADLCRAVRRETVSAAGDSLTKEDRSPVTVADFGSQALVCRRLHEAFPEIPIVAEEDSSALVQSANRAALAGVVRHVAAFHPATEREVRQWIDLGNGVAGDRYWTVDPIDGTKGFLRQDQYAVAVALVARGVVRVGVLACPAMNLRGSDTGDGVGTLFAAVRGNGAFQMPLDGDERTPIRVADPEDASSRRFVESVEAAHGNHDLQRAVARAAGIESPSLRMDSQAKYGAVARGDAVLYLRLPSPGAVSYREQVWDHAAGTVVVEAAGGRVTDLFGEALDFGAGPRLENNQGVVVSNGAMHDRVIEALRMRWAK